MRTGQSEEYVSIEYVSVVQLPEDVKEGVLPYAVVELLQLPSRTEDEVDGERELFWLFWSVNDLTRGGQQALS